MSRECRSCWWQEGGRCYSDTAHGGPVPRDENGRAPVVTPEHYVLCVATGARTGKRAVLERALPGTIELLIESETP